MQKTERKDIWFNSSNRVNRVAGYFYTSPEVKPFCVVQISHGMCEHISRYEDFAAFLNQHGIAVCGNDHLGHGLTASGPEEYGFFAKSFGRRYAVQDLKTMNTLAHEEFPGLPVILLGHSMGSFFARQYAAQYPSTIDGLLISGTGGPNPLAKPAALLTSLIARQKGNDYRSEVVHQMAFRSYLRYIPHPRTEYDWISRDNEIVDIYAADPLCTFRFTVSGFHELFLALEDVSSPQWAERIAKTMPVFLFSGDADPVGDYGKGTDKVYRWLKDAGVRNLEYKLYPGGRHEMINETNRSEVYQDVLRFINRWWNKS